MIDIKLIRDNKDLVKENIKKKFQDEKLPIVDEVFEMDKEVREVQAKCDGLKADKNKKSGEIGKLMKDKRTDEANKVKEEVSVLQKDREEFKKNIPTNILSQYERIRENRNGQGLALVNGDSCGGCNMVLRPQLIVQATKCKELVYCDNCSRILFNKKGIQE